MRDSRASISTSVDDHTEQSCNQDEYPFDAMTAQPVTSAGSRPGNELQSPRRSDVIDHSMRSLVKAAIYLQLAIRSVLSPDTPKVAPLR